MTVPAPSAAWLPAAFRRGVLWLLLLAPLFFLSYGFANHHAARVDAASGVPALVFAWETAIPFWPWTILPYWSIDLLYGFAFLCCRHRAASNRLGLRLLTAQAIAIGCFLLWPLRFGFTRPETTGWTGALFSALTQFDLPYNQAPSLHIALLVIVWRQFATLPVARPLRGFIHGWALLIGVSVLTTWQHHFIDVPTGLALGLFCLWLWPDAPDATPLRRSADAGGPGARRLAYAYLLGAAAALALALWLGGLGRLFACLLLAWLALALLLLACCYAWSGAAGFQKGADGQFSLAARWLFAPYTLLARLNAWAWTRRHPQADHIAEGIWLGPLASARPEWALFDLTAELPAPPVAAYAHLPCLDLVPLSAQTLLAAADRLEKLRRPPGRPKGDAAPSGGSEQSERGGSPCQECGEVLVACALGVSRSAAVVACWLHRHGPAADPEAALALLRRQRPQVVLDARWQAALLATACHDMPRTLGDNAGITSFGSKA